MLGLLDLLIGQQKARQHPRISISNDHLQLGVLVLELLQTAQLHRLHAVVPRLPVEVGKLRVPGISGAERLQNFSPIPGSASSWLQRRSSAAWRRARWNWIPHEHARNRASSLRVAYCSVSLTNG